MSARAIRAHFAGSVALALAASVCLVAIDVVSARAQQGHLPRRLVLNLSGRAFSDMKMQDGLMFSVPWKDFVEEFFPRQGVHVSVNFMGREVEKDARNRLFDPERAKFMLTNSSFGSRLEVRVICEPNVCHVAESLRSYLKKVGLVPWDAKLDDNKADSAGFDDMPTIRVTLDSSSGK